MALRIRHRVDEPRVLAPQVLHHSGIGAEVDVGIDLVHRSRLRHERCALRVGGIEDQLVFGVEPGRGV